MDGAEAGVRLGLGLPLGLGGSRGLWLGLRALAGAGAVYEGRMTMAPP